jgi:hypothetical protein
VGGQSLWQSQYDSEKGKDHLLSGQGVEGIKKTVGMAGLVLAVVAFNRYV